jgi:hypothetical protein
MNSLSDRETARASRVSFVTTAGLALIAFGILILADQYLHTGWLTDTIPLLAGLILLYRGLSNRSLGLVIAGGITSAVGAGLLAAFSPAWGGGLHQRVTLFITFTALGWITIYWLAAWTSHRRLLWTLVTAGVTGGIAAWFWLNPVPPIAYILFFPTAIGLTLLLCGLMYRLFGLIIPGCILLGIGPGVYFAWGQVGEPNGLAQTGFMLVTFALGWGLITVFSRVITSSFIWWPLIPGGILAMVGWGLYIGGDPHNALSFIGNTGSIGLIIFGIYLLMWRNEIRRK